MKKLNEYFESKKGFGLAFLRMVGGWRLAGGVWAYALFQIPIREVSGFFESLHLPLPLFSAYLSVYLQFICGILFILGLLVRPAAIVMILNFCIAILAAHTDDHMAKSFQAWALLGISICLLFEGPGRFAIKSYFK